MLYLGTRWAPVLYLGVAGGYPMLPGRVASEPTIIVVEANLPDRRAWVCGGEWERGSLKR